MGWIRRADGQEKQLSGLPRPEHSPCGIHTRMVLLAASDLEEEPYLQKSLAFLLKVVTG